jgi:hypothetical protein
LNQFDLFSCACSTDLTFVSQSPNFVYYSGLLV